MSGAVDFLNYGLITNLNLDISHSYCAAEMDIDSIPVCIINVIPEYSAVGIICSPSYIIAEGECHIIGADRVYFRAHAATDQVGTFIQLFPVSKNELSVKADRKCLSAVKLYICCMI